MDAKDNFKLKKQMIKMQNLSLLALKKILVNEKQLKKKVQSEKKPQHWISIMYQLRFMKKLYFLNYLTKEKTKKKITKNNKQMKIDLKN